MFYFLKKEKEKIIDGLCSKRQNKNLLSRLLKGINYVLSLPQSRNLVSIHIFQR